MSMTTENREALHLIVREHIATYGEALTASRIMDAHLGNPDGLLVTNENLHLFRQYRNTVTADPRPLIAESLQDA